tara:strand:- start:213 stop:767 length:555 start_codon:yes stop_codon:yes gene_type:complete
VVSSHLCQRVGCGQEAEAVLLMVPQECRAWLVSDDHDAAKDGSHLCTDHADRMTVPVGWVLSDERNSPKKRRRRGTKQTKAKKKSSRRESKQTPTPDEELASVVDEIPVDDAPLPADVNEVEELTSEPFEESFLQVVSEGSFPESEVDDLVQGSLWEDTSPMEKLDPGEETPLLQRAFRVVSDE